MGDELKAGAETPRRRGARQGRAAGGSHSAGPEVILVTDRWSAYNGWKTRLRQVCWAHLLREFTAFSERAGEAARIGRDLLECVEKMFDWWYRVRDGMMTVAATLKQQKRNIIDYLTQAAEAALHGRPAPSLIPVAVVTGIARAAR